MNLATFSIYKMFGCEGNEESRDICFGGVFFFGRCGGGMWQLDSAGKLACRSNLERWEKRRVTQGFKSLKRCALRPVCCCVDELAIDNL